jgi:ABC-type amino acid transport substrate-binding protein
VLGRHGHFVERHQREWIPAEEIDPASSLHAVLERGRLRIGHVDAQPYVFRANAAERIGIDYDTGQALAAIVARHYPRLRPEPEWVLVGGSYAEESSKFSALYDGLGKGGFDVAMSGQANIGSEIAEVDWLCATDLCFTNFLYTGRDGFRLGALTTRDEIVAKLKTLGEITLGYVANNPGPSSPSAANLKRDVGENVTLVPFQGAAALNTAVANAECHFTVGDGIASSWLSLTQWPNVTNFNVQVALPANPPQQVAGFTLTGL